MIHKCCYIGDAGDDCNKPAEWVIVCGTEPEDYTESCRHHVGYMLTDAQEHRIYQLNEEND